MAKGIALLSIWQWQTDGCAISLRWHSYTFANGKPMAFFFLLSFFSFLTSIFYFKKGSINVLMFL